MDKNIFVRFRGLSILGIGTIVSHSITGIFWLYLARIVEIEQYGEITYFITLAGIVSIISMLGTGNTITVYSAKKINIQPALYLMVIIASIVSAIILFFISSNVFVSVNIIGFCIFSLVSFELLGTKHYTKWTSFQISQKIIMVILSIILYHELGVNGVILGIGLSYFPMAIIHIANVFKEKEIDFSLIKPRIGFIRNNYVMEVARYASSSIDKIFVVPLLGFAMLANYQLSLQILTFLWIVPAIVYQYILPLDASGIPNRGLKIFSVVIVSVLAISAIILAPILIPQLFPKFTESILLIQIVSISIIPNSIYTIYVSKFLGNEKSKPVLVSSIIFVIVQISSIIILGSIFGIIGIASSLVLSSFIQLLYMIIIDQFQKNKLAKK